MPVTVLEPKQGRPHTVIWADPQGKNGLYARTEQGGYRLAPAIQKLLSRGVTVIGADLLFQGEFLTDDQAVTRTRKVSNPREAAAYSFGYNYTLFAQRVQDLLSVIQYARNHIRGLERLDLVGQTGAGPLAAAAKAQAGPAIQRLAIDAGGFRFAKVTDIHDINFLPGGAKYGDLPGMLALGAPGKLRLAGEGTEAPALLKQVYQLAGAPQNVTLTQADPKWDAEAVADWLLTE